MKELGKAKTIQDLVNILYHCDPLDTYYGWDDGSIIVVDHKTGDEIGYIDLHREEPCSE